MNISQETLRFDQNATGAWRLAATCRGARAHSYQCHGPGGYSGSRVSSCVAWARGGEGAVAELPRATGSRPNSSRFKFSFFSDLRQQQVGQNTHLRQFTIRCHLPDKHTVLSVCVSVRDFKCLDACIAWYVLTVCLLFCVYVCMCAHWCRSPACLPDGMLPFMACAQNQSVVDPCSSECRGVYATGRNLHICMCTGFTRMRGWILTHTHTHAHIHTYTNTHTHTRTHTHSNANVKP